MHIQVEICVAMILALPPTQSASPIINGDDDSEPIRENLLVKHVSVVVLQAFILQSCCLCNACVLNLFPTFPAVSEVPITAENT